MFYSLRPASVLEKRFGQIGRPLAFCPFANGETVHFIWRHGLFDSAEVRAFDWGAPKPLGREASELEPGASLTGLTAFVANDPSVDGHIRLWEVSNLVLTKRAGDEPN